MNHVIAYELLSSEMATYRNIGFNELRQLVGERTSFRKRGQDGVEYDFLIIVRWRMYEGGDIRVIGFIGEAGWGGPHDSVDDTFVVPAPIESTDQTTNSPPA
jgi:hypothetical protein